MQKTSVLFDLVNGKLTEQTDLETTRKLCIETIQSSDCFARDARKMLIELQRFTNIVQIQKYIFNAYLRYSGLGVINSPVK